MKHNSGDLPHIHIECLQKIVIQSDREYLQLVIMTRSILPFHSKFTRPQGKRPQHMWSTTDDGPFVKDPLLIEITIADTITIVRRIPGSPSIPVAVSWTQPYAYLQKRVSFSRGWRGLEEKNSVSLLVNVQHYTEGENLDIVESRASVIDRRSIRLWHWSLFYGAERRSSFKDGSSRGKEDPLNVFFLTNSVSKKMKWSRCTSKFRQRLPSFFNKILFWKLCAIP
jgi:hypothetical protein